MLGFCLTPFPDELFYSWCSRMANFIGVATMGDILRELFGKRGQRVHVAFPSRIAHLVNQLPPQGQVSCNELIEQHTLFPLYRPFLVPEDAQVLRVFMLDGKDKLQLGKSGLLRALRHHSTFLRYCPKCVRADRIHVGEPYWHRVHQVPGVLVCPTHGVYLESSSIPSQNRRSSEELQPACRARLNARPRGITRTDPGAKKLIRLAEDSKELLEQPAHSGGPDGLMRRYRLALLEACPGRFPRRIDSQEVRRQFVGFYSPELLTALGVDMGEAGSWFSMRRLWQGTNLTVQTPLLHLLLMQFLGCRPTEFFSRAEVPEPFGGGPWPCLNPVCDDFLKDVINEVAVTFVAHRSEYRGQFRCRCGFQYHRYQSNRDRNRYCGVSQYGPVWEDKLRALWDDLKYSITGIGRVFGMSPEVIYGLARTLCVDGRRPFPPWVSRLGMSSSRERSRKKRGAPLDLESDRKVLTEFIEQHPGVSRQDVSRAVARSFYRLRHYDRPWLMAHLPPPRQFKRPTVNWTRRDGELSTQVQLAIERIRKQPIPQQIGRSSIARELGSNYLIGCNLNRLPKTAGLLKTLSP